MHRKIVAALFIFMGLMIMSGCAHWNEVMYNDLKQDNTARITLVSGETMNGTVKKIEPHQIVILKDGRLHNISKSSIQSVKILPPVYDDLGNCISEYDIRKVKKNKNALIYGLGGGALSSGTSLFISSMLAGENATKSTVFGETAAGTAVGTFLFVKAGMAKDRKEAIEKIKQERQARVLKKRKVKKNDQTNMRDLINKEKAKQQTLQKEREELLKKLNKKKK
ncbi:hypothetical protein J7K93_00390 [bacterium]|nr:hypothetical protein [bacterium]